MSNTIDNRYIGRVCPSQIVSTPESGSENHLYFVDRQADPELYNRPFYDHQTVFSNQTKPFALPIHKRLNLPTPRLCIFHKGRVGSTLVCKIIDQIPNFISLKEPGIVNQICRTELTPHHKAIALFNMIGLLVSHAQRYTGKSNVVLKCTSWQITYLPLYQEVYPQLPFLFLNRINREVMDSLKARPPGWMQSLTTDAELLQYLVKMETQAKKYCNHMLDYTDLLKPKFNTWLLGYLGITAFPAILQQMVEVRKYHSKTGKPLNPIS